MLFLPHYYLMTMEDDKDKQIERVESRIIVLRGRQVIIDRDVAELYGVETKAINQAVKRNADKFPDNYMFQLNKGEKLELVTNCDRFDLMKHSTVMPKAFTEQGLYMLATVLRSPLATQTTFAIIETFTQLRILARKIHAANDMMEQGTMITTKEQGKIQTMMNDVFTDHLPIKMQKMSFGVDFGFFKFKVETTREKQ